IRMAPRVHDPDPHYDDVVAEVCSFLADRAGRARAAGIGADMIVVDAGFDLGKTPSQSLELLRASASLAELGYPLLLSASNKQFLGALFDLAIEERRDVSLGAVAVGIALGCRIVRVHDVVGARQVCDALEAVLRAS
ncbi:MAG: dihydropteroate synthase, partial [Acidimicrobiales bacterium]